MIFPNKKYAKLVALSFIRNVRGGRVWTWQCECGGTTLATDRSVLDGDITACPACEPRVAKKKDKPEQREEKARVREQFANEHNIWRGILYRCKHDPDYAGRGIAVCSRWSSEDGFENFLADMGPRPSEAHSVGRIDNDGGYQPDNCRWELPEAQAKNQRGRTLVEYDGQQRLLVELCEERGIKLSTVRTRIDQLGMTLKEALETPVAVRKGGKKNPLTPQQEAWIIERFQAGERGWRTWAKQLNEQREEGSPKVTTGAIYELLVSKGFRKEMRLYGAPVTRT